MEVSGEIHDPAYSLAMRMGGTQSRSGLGDEKKKFITPSLPGIEHQLSSQQHSHYND
jgi:hypothetical protein